jgi:predicted HTH transcriptional regulator
MEAEDILKLRDLGEDSKIQFKERILDKYDVGCELVAFSNFRGGQLVVGINDKTGAINPLSYQEAQETTNMLGNMASDNVVPSILLDIETVEVDGGCIVVANIKEGINKPYHDNKGIVWVKNGADKRKVFDNAELAEMMTECGSFAPDEAAVRNATIDDLDENTVKLFLRNKFSSVLERKGMVGDTLRDASLDAVCNAIAQGHNAERLLRNLRFILPDGKLTVAAILLFAKYTQRLLPVMTAKCISFVGNSVGSTQFRDKVQDTDMEGNMLHQFEMIMAFFKRNLRTVQVEKEFNSLGELEIPYISLVEFTVNALVHRSLNWNAPIRIFIFDDRVEIHSPGTLPNGLSVEDIIAGTSMPRNNFLFANAIYLLPYTGAGSGMQRALEKDLKVTFSNNEQLHEFLVIIGRESNQVDSKSNQVEGEEPLKSNQVDLKSNQVESEEPLKSNQVENILANKRIKLSRIQKDILNFCSIPRTAQEIMDRIGLSNQSKNRAKYISSLVEAGYLEMTFPDSPNAKNQKYRKKIK